MSPFSAVLVYTLLCIYTATVWSCTPVVHYPAITNLQRLASDDSKILLTILDEESGAFCVLYTINDQDIDTSTFSDPVTCGDYDSDTLAFVYGTDATSTQITSITSTDGLEISRNGVTRYIDWAEIPGGVAQTIASDDIESFTFDATTTFVRIGAKLYALEFKSAGSEDYVVWNVLSDDYFNLVDVELYRQYSLISFVDYYDPCSRLSLFNYTAGYDMDANVYRVNFTDNIGTAYNIDVDNRTNYAFFWGNSAAFQVFDIVGGAVHLVSYTMSTSAPGSHAVSLATVINFSFIIALVSWM